jgi:hypothetical protein
MPHRSYVSRLALVVFLGRLRRADHRSCTDAGRDPNSPARSTPPTDDHARIKEGSRMGMRSHSGPRSETLWKGSSVLFAADPDPTTLTAAP